MQHCIYANTAPGCNYPSYVSVNTDSENPNEVVLTVRSEIKTDGACGETAAHKMGAAEFREFARRLYSFACTNAA